MELKTRTFEDSSLLQRMFPVTKEDIAGTLSALEGMPLASVQRPQRQRNKPAVKGYLSPADGPRANYIEPFLSLFNLLRNTFCQTMEHRSTMPC